MKIVAKLAGTCILAFGLAFGALFVFSDTVNHTFDTPPASAGLHGLYPPSEREVVIYPSQVSGIAYYAAVYGEPTAAYVFCVSNYSNNSAEGDCFGLLSSNAYNAYNVIEWWAHYGDGTEWQWGYTLNNYVGYSVF